MRERSVKIGSAGKIFSLTGWKVGFVAAALHIMKVLAKSHQFLTFTTPPNLQVAVAYGLAEDGYFEGMRRDFARSRDRFAAGLETLGFQVIPSQGTYFLNIDIAPQGETDDVALPPPRDGSRRRGDPGLGLLCARRGQERGPLLLRQEGRDAGRGTGAARRRRQEGGLTGFIHRSDFNIVSSAGST